MCRKPLSKLILRAMAGVALGALVAPGAWAAEILGVQPAALDQPRINALIQLTPTSDPLEFEDTFNIQAFFDTGASGILLSTQTAGLLGVQPAQYNGQDIIFSDVGVAGTDDFFVSGPIHIRLAPYHPEADVDNRNTYPTVYNQAFGPVRAQIGPVLDEGEEPNPLLEGLDVFGVPLMRNKVVVMDPKPVNTFLDTMRTYVYEPGTPFRPATADSDPGIPATSHHVRLSYGNFDRFTTVTPAEATPFGPTLGDNPFIGPNPVRQLMQNPPPDDTPGIRIEHNSMFSEGSWLLDTGAAASIISRAQAAAVGVTYVEGTYNTDNPVLAGVPEDEQFTLTIGGIGGTAKIAGFFLDSMLMRTQEGNAADPNDPNHFKFIGAPVLVGDITLKDPQTQQELTLDGIFGMNFLVASAFVSEGAEGEFPFIGNLTYGRFDWLVYDDQNGVLGLQPTAVVGGQAPLAWIGDFFSEEVEWNTVDQYWIDTATFSGGIYEDGDHVAFGDSASTDITIVEPVAPGGIFFANPNSDYIFRGAAIQGETGLIKEGAGSVTFRNQNTYQGPTDIREGSLILEARQDIGPVNVHDGALVSMRTSQQFAELNIASGGAAVMSSGGGKVLVLTDSIQILGTGQLDLADNAMILRSNFVDRADDRELVAGYIKSGLNAEGEFWTGPGITSSTAATVAQNGPLTAVGVIVNDFATVPGLPSGAIYDVFEGESVGRDDILVKYTWFGDADLNGVVDGTDYFLIDNAFSSHAVNGGWLNGDFDYSGVVDGTDYFLIDNAFGAQGAPLSAGISSVPEPAAASILAVGMLAALRRRRAWRKPASFLISFCNAPPVP